MRGGEAEVILASKYILRFLLLLTISKWKTQSAYLKVRLIFIYIDPFMQLEFYVPINSFPQRSNNFTRDLSLLFGHNNYFIYIP